MLCFPVDYIVSYRFSKSPTVWTIPKFKNNFFYPSSRRYNSRTELDPNIIKILPIKYIQNGVVTLGLVSPSSWYKLRVARTGKRKQILLQLKNEFLWSFKNANLVFFTLTKPPSLFFTLKSIYTCSNKYSTQNVILSLRSTRIIYSSTVIFPNLKKIYNGVYVYIRYAS